QPTPQPQAVPAPQSGMPEAQAQTETFPNSPRLPADQTQTEQPPESQTQAQGQQMQAQPQAAAPQAAPSPIPMGPASLAIYKTLTPDQQAAFQQHYQEIAPRLLNENMKSEQDLANGHITPKTYNDLLYYNQDGSEKSTLGKIGTIFKALVSGGGA